MSNPGDLDGDGTFDAIDISIMENDGDSVANKGGCGFCAVLLFFGSLFAAGFVVVDYFA